jgi:glycerate 2-kinase
VVTGEGAIDRSTLMGKGVGELARLVRQAGLPCIGLAGVVPDEALAAKRFTWVRGIVPGLAEPAVAKANPAPLLRQLARQAAASFNVKRHSQR